MGGCGLIFFPTSTYVARVPSRARCATYMTGRTCSMAGQFDNAGIENGLRLLCRSKPTSDLVVDLCAAAAVLRGI